MTGSRKPSIMIWMTTSLDLNRTDFDYLTGAVGKTCGLDVKADHLVGKGGIALTKDTLSSIVYKVRLGTVENLKIGLRLLKSEHNLGECLHVAVIGDGYRLMSPTKRGVHKLLRGDDSIHL